MTPQEKARELYDLYRPIFFGEHSYKSLSKKCALIAVEEIKKAHPIVPLTYMLESEAIDAAIEYWNEVKAEIEKL
jgi:hypothetical protein